MIDVQYFPLQIDDFGQPHFVEDAQKSLILNDMRDESYKLASESSNTKQPGDEHIQ